MKENILHKKVRIMLAVLALLSVIFGLSITQGFAVVRPPNPVMNYVPQYVGIYDTYYGYYVADDCRVCHGDRNAVAKRHQYSASAFAGCPDGCPLSPPDCLSACHTDPNNPETITDNCLTCHPATSYGGSGPHHETDLADSGQCTTCHQPDFLVRTKSVKPSSYYPPAYMYTPTPVTCENCHWPSGDVPHTPPPDWPKPIESQGMAATGDLHPSKAYRPYDYGTHAGVGGNVIAQCYFCHANTSNTFNVDPSSPMAIRYCENCHSKDSLHSIEEHVTAGHGLTPNEKCVACHGGMPSNPLVLALKPPVITSISPSFGPNGTSFSLMGENFGSTGSVLLTARMSRTGKTYKISSGSCTWTSGNIECAMPSGLAAGNYNAKVQTLEGTSNTRVFTLTKTPDCIPCPASVPTITSIKPTIGAPYALVTIRGQNFGDRHAGDRDVLLINPYGTSEAVIQSWTDTMIKLRIKSWELPVGIVEVQVKTEEGESLTNNFEVTDEPKITSLDYSDGIDLIIAGEGFHDTRLGMHADGYGWKSSVRISSPGKTITVGPKRITNWSDTEIRLRLPQLQTDTYGVTVKTIYFYDKDKDGKFTSGVDTVHQTVESDPKPLIKP